MEKRLIHIRKQLVYCSLRTKRLQGVPCPITGYILYDPIGKGTWHILQLLSFEKKKISKMGSGLTSLGRVFRALCRTAIPPSRRGLGCNRNTNTASRRSDRQCGTGGGKNDNEYYTNERIEIMIMVIQNRNSEIRGKVQKGNGI